MSSLRITACAGFLALLGVSVYWTFDALEGAREHTAPQIDNASTAPGDTGLATAGPSQLQARRWLQDYTSRDHAARDAAVEEMKSDGAVLWPGLIALAENPRTPAELRDRARAALVEYSRPQLNYMLFKLMADRDESLRELEEERQRFSQRCAALNRAAVDVAARRVPFEAQGEALSDAGRQALDELDLERKKLKADERRLKQILDTDTQRIRTDLNVFDSYICQLGHLMESPGYLPVASVQEWSPELVPEKYRHSLHVSFELVDMDLQSICAHLKQLSGLDLTIDPGALDAKDIVVNLRVTDMEVSAAAHWVGRLAELNTRHEGARITFVHGHQAALPPPPDVEAPKHRPAPAAVPEAPGDF